MWAAGKSTKLVAYSGRKKILNDFRNLHRAYNNGAIFSQTTKKNIKKKGEWRTKMHVPLVTGLQILNICRHISRAKWRKKKKWVGPKKVLLTQLLLLMIRNMFVIRYTFIISFVLAPPTNCGTFVEHFKIACMRRKENESRYSRKGSRRRRRDYLLHITIAFRIIYCLPKLRKLQFALNG